MDCDLLMSYLMIIEWINQLAREIICKIISNLAFSKDVNPGSISFATPYSWARRFYSSSTPCAEKLWLNPNNFSERKNESVTILERNSYIWLLLWNEIRKIKIFINKFLNFNVFRTCAALAVCGCTFGCRTFPFRSRDDLQRNWWIWGEETFSRTKHEWKSHILVRFVSFWHQNLKFAWGNFSSTSLRVTGGMSTFW